MDPADLQRKESLGGVDDTPVSSSKMMMQTPTSSAWKTGVPRVDVEPMYTALKAAVGEGWTQYKTALHDFLMGKLNQLELSRILSVLLSPAPSVSQNGSLVSTLHLHNVLLFAIYSNIHRDPPPDAVASWVMATDAPASAHQQKPASQGAGDKAEERLKREVMALSARDRRRIKQAKDNVSQTPNSAPLYDNIAYATALTVPVTSNAAPEALPPTTSTLSKTNWDLEIRRRYAMPLASETLEFPSRQDIQARIEPICYEEGVGLSSVPMTSGTLISVAELVESATEMFVKETLAKWFSTTRSNTEGAPLTAKYRAQVRREEDAVDHGELARSAAGLLPCEIEAHAHRDPLNIDEVRLSLRLDETRFRHDPFLAQQILDDIEMDMSDESPGLLNGGLDALDHLTAHDPDANHGTNGDPMNIDEDMMNIDADDWGWQGAANTDRDVIMGVLDSVLATVAS